MFSDSPGSLCRWGGDTAVSVFYTCLCPLAMDQYLVQSLEEMILGTMVDLIYTDAQDVHIMSTAYVN